MTSRKHTLAGLKKYNHSLRQIAIDIMTSWVDRLGKSSRKRKQDVTDETVSAWLNPTDTQDIHETQPLSRDIAMEWSGVPTQSLPGVNARNNRYVQLPLDPNATGQMEIISDNEHVLRTPSMVHVINDMHMISEDHAVQVTECVDNMHSNPTVHLNPCDITQNDVRDGHHVAIMIIIDADRFMLTIGSTDGASWILPMSDSVDNALLLAGWRRDSSWEWTSGFLACDIVCDV